MPRSRKKPEVTDTLVLLDRKEIQRNRTDTFSKCKEVQKKREINNIMLAFLADYS